MPLLAQGAGYCRFCFVTFDISIFLSWKLTCWQRGPY